MKRLNLIIGTLFLPTAISLAIVDTNENGLSDLWEQAYNNGDLYPETYDPQADPDQDGWTNAQEAAAGTDPCDPIPPAGIIAPDLVHTSAVMGTDGNGQPILITPEVLTVSWPTIIGKQYTLLFSPDLSAPSWLQVPQSTFIGDGNIHEFNFDISSGSRCFWRVSVSDLDTDEDGLSDAEEFLFGTNSILLDTDSDTISDSEEIALGTDPVDYDSDNDLVTNAMEIENRTDMNNSSDFPPFWIIVTNRAIGGTNTDGTTYGGTIRYSQWDRAEIAEKPLRDMPADIDNAIMVAERDGLSLPATAEVALAVENSPTVVCEPLSGDLMPAASSSFYRSITGGSSANYSAIRCWLRVPIKVQPQQFQFLKHVRHTRTGVAGDLDETLSCEVTLVNIPANQSTSEPINLTNSTLTEAGSTHVTTTSLLPLEVVNSDGAPVFELEVAKMEVGPFKTLDANGNLTPANSNESFYLRVRAPESLNGIAIKISTTNNPDITYDDDSTQAELMFRGDKWISDAMLMVSDDVDDDKPVDNISDDSTNDPTHKIQLGGSFKIDAIKCGAGSWQDIGRLVPVEVKKTVHVNVVVLRDKPLSEGGQQVFQLTEVMDHWKIVSERYAQVGLKVVVDTYRIADPPSGVDLSDGLSVQNLGATVLEDEVKTLIESIGTTDTEDIHIFYVKDIDIGGIGGPRGIAIADFAFEESEAQYSYNAFIARQLNSPYGLVAAHELGHLLTNDGHGETEEPFPYWRLMFGGVLSDAGITGSKRLVEDEEEKIHSDSHVQ